MKTLKTERVAMSGRGPRYTYKIVDANGSTQFKTGANSYLSWTRKKDAQRIIDSVEIHGMDYVKSKLDLKEY